MIVKNLTFQVFLAAVLAVLVASLVAPIADDGMLAQTIGFLKSTFLAALKMLIAPMIFFSLISGIISIGDVVKLRSLGSATVMYYLGTTFLAICLALFVVFFVHPWTNYPPSVEIVDAIPESRMIDPGSDSIILVLQQIFKLAFTNPFTALVELNILGIVANAFLIGIAMVLVLPKTNPLFEVVSSINQVIFKILSWVIRLLPVGIFAILFDFTLRLSGGDGHSQNFLTQLFQFAGVVVAITLIHGLVVLPLVAMLMTGQNPVQLLRRISRPLIVAFSTSSSAATLPVTMKTCEEDLGVQRSVSSFVLPLGATMNMDGTALFEALAAVFLAYLYGIELSNIALITIFLMSMVASIGAPGMPSASMSGMQMVLIAVGIPLEAIAILLVIERPLDTVRTAVNVEGDIIGTLVVSKLTGSQLNPVTADSA
ncbi:MAG: dicarboxylate/amino acid:cation symporter [Pseudomonadales bacterium]